MEKSIESIWKEGFLKNDMLVAPKLNNLYNQKSKTLIEKIQRMMKINLIMILAASLLILVWWYFNDVLYLGIFIFALLNAVAIYGVIQMDRMKKTIDYGESSYHYLKTFHHWISNVIENNTKLMRFFYPLMFIAAAGTVWYSNDNEIFLSQLIIRHFPNVVMWGGIPMVFIVLVLVIAAVMAVFGGSIYKWDVDLVYGRVFKKLDEIIADMEELRS
jgi:hypothetical protein